MLAALRAHPTALLPAEVDEATASMLQRAREIQAGADETALSAALARLREAPDDAAAREAVLARGSRAIPFVRAALREALGAPEPDTARIQTLHDLLKSLRPAWAGFPADASVEEKLKSLEQLPDA